jgi:hypothetical protein
MDFHKLSVADCEKKRLQKLVEESDIEMTHFLFYGESTRHHFEKEKEKEKAKEKEGMPVNNIVNVERKNKKTLATTIKPFSNLNAEKRKEVFGEPSDGDPYEDEYGRFF